MANQPEVVKLNDDSLSKEATFLNLIQEIEKVNSFTLEHHNKVITTLPNYITHVTSKDTEKFRISCAHWLDDFKFIIESAKSYLEKAEEIYKDLETLSDTQALHIAAAKLYKAKTLYQEMQDNYATSEKLLATFQNYYQLRNSQDNAFIDAELAHRLGEAYKTAFSYQLTQEDDVDIANNASGRFPSNRSIPEQKSIQVWEAAANSTFQSTIKLIP